MRGGRILWGQIAVVFTIVMVTTWAATQWVAFRLGFQPQLGRPWFYLAGWPFYHPPAFFWWWFSFDAYAPAIFMEGAAIATSGGILAIVAAILMSIIRAREARNVATYGSARWAEGKEIRSAGLLGPDGVLLGRYDRDYLRHDGPEHVLCFAPTRSGKGVGLVVPTGLEVRHHRGGRRLLPVGRHVGSAGSGHVAPPGQDRPADRHAGRRSRRARRDSFLVRPFLADDHPTIA